MMTLLLFTFVLGLLFLVVGADLLVRGASRLALAAGVSALVTGLTVVAYGTSAPELAVSVQSVFSGRADVAIGNVVGSNIFNVLFILGVSAAITPLVVSQRLVWKEVPLMIGASLLFWILGANGRIGRVEGLVLVAIVIAHTVLIIRQSRTEGRQTVEKYEVEFGGPIGDGPSLSKAAGMIILGLVLLILGARWLVESAVTMARAAGFSDLIIGLTIVAAGTSLPEVATSVIASLRGERDIAVGNVIGSNLFNILAVAGLSSLVSTQGLEVLSAATAFDIPVMTAVAVACLPVFFTGHVIARWEGFLFLGYYLAYTAYIIMDASGHDALPLFSNVMWMFALPVTVLTMVLVVIRAIRSRAHGI